MYNFFNCKFTNPNVWWNATWLVVVAETRSDATWDRQVWRWLQQWVTNPRRTGHHGVWRGLRREDIHEVDNHGLVLYNKNECEHKNVIPYAIRFLRCYCKELWNSARLVVQGLDVQSKVELLIYWVEILEVWFVSKQVSLNSFAK